MLVEVYFWIFSQNYYPIHQNDLPSVWRGFFSSKHCSNQPPQKKHPATVRCFFHVFFHAWRRERREIPITHCGSVTPAETGCQCINQTNGSTVTNVNSPFWGIYCGFKEDMFSFNVILWGDDLILIWHSQIHKCVAKKTPPSWVECSSVPPYHRNDSLSIFRGSWWIFTLNS